MTTLGRQVPFLSILNITSSITILRAYQNVLEWSVKTRHGTHCSATRLENMQCGTAADLQGLVRPLQLFGKPLMKFGALLITLTRTQPLIAMSCCNGNLRQSAFNSLVILPSTICCMMQMGLSERNKRNREESDARTSVPEHAPCCFGA